MQVLTGQPDLQTARKYWNKLKERLGKEGSQLVTDCHQLKMTAADGKQRLTDVSTAETLLCPVQSVPSPKAEPIKMWFTEFTASCGGGVGASICGKQPFASVETRRGCPLLCWPPGWSRPSAR